MLSSLLQITVMYICKRQMVSSTHLELDSSSSSHLSIHIHTHMEEGTGKGKIKRAPIWSSPICTFLSVILQVWENQSLVFISLPFPMHEVGVWKSGCYFLLQNFPFHHSTAAVGSHEPSYGCSFRGTWGTRIEYLGDGATWKESELSVTRCCYFDPVTRWQRQIFSVKWPQSSPKKKEMEGFTASELI